VSALIRLGVSTVGLPGDLVDGGEEQPQIEPDQIDTGQCDDHVTVHHGATSNDTVQQIHQTRQGGTVGRTRGKFVHYCTTS